MQIANKNTFLSLLSLSILAGLWIVISSMNSKNSFKAMDFVSIEELVNEQKIISWISVNSKNEKDMLNFLENQLLKETAAN